MRIRTQLLITMGMFGVILVVISASVIITSRQVEEATKQEEIASRIAQGANELAYLSNDYLVYGESQQLSRWQSRYATFSSDVAALHVDKPDQQAFASNIRANEQRLKEVFDSLVAAVGPPRQTGDPMLDPSLFQVSWSRMAVQSQGLVSDASRLSRLLRDQTDQTRQTNMTVILAMIGVFATYFLVNYLVIQRRLLNSITVLRAGTLVIGSGDLDFRIEEKRNDEIGELSRAFNQMTSDLKGVTASKAELEREIAERKRAEAEREQLLERLQTQNEELQTQSEEIQSQYEELHAVNKELEQATRTAEDAVRARDEFLSVAAHELKTPVTSLRGFAQTLLRQHERKGAVEPERLSRALEVIDQQSNKLTKLVSQLLDLSRLEGGRLVLQRQNADLAHLVEEVVAAARLHTTGHTLIFDARGQAEAFVDPLRIEQVLTNLVDNAIRYSPDGGVIEIKVIAGQGEAKIAVYDQGIGIPPEHRPYVFDRFYRADEGGSVAGLGLGLFISKEIVTLHGGRIEVEGTPEGGSCFTVSLPSVGAVR